MKLKKLYYYLYYKLYKLSEAAPSRWLSDWKAELAIDILEGFFIFSLLTYYTVFVNRHFQIPNSFIIIMFYILTIALPNYFIFHRRDQWKSIVHEFDKIPKNKNRIGGWIVFIIILLVIANLVFAFYQMSQINWKLYR